MSAASAAAADLSSTGRPRRATVRRSFVEPPDEDDLDGFDEPADSDGDFEDEEAGEPSAELAPLPCSQPSEPVRHS